MTRQLIAQGIGFLAVGTSLFIYFQTKRRRLLFAKMIQDTAWLLHYLLLGCLTPAMTSGINITRSIVFSASGKHQWAKSRLWLFLYMALYIGCVPLTWKNVWSILPVTSSLISTVSFYMQDVKKTKMLAMAATCVTLIYNVLVSHSISVYCGVAFTFSSSCLSLIATYRKEKRTPDH